MKKQILLLLVAILSFGQVKSQNIYFAPGYLFTSLKISTGDSTLFSANANNVSLGMRGEKRTLDGHLGVFAGANFQFFNSKVDVGNEENVIRVTAITPHVRVKYYMEKNQGPFLLAGSQLFLVPFNTNENVDLSSVRFEGGAGIAFENGMAVNISAANSFIKSLNNDNRIGKSWFFGVDVDIRIGEFSLKSNKDKY